MPPAIYGTPGTPSASNGPGARYSASSWTDSSGNLWLFGGVGYDSGGADGNLNDLWRYSPSTRRVDLDQWQQRGQCHRGLWNAGHRRARQRAGRALFGEFVDRLLRQPVAVRRIRLRLDRRRGQAQRPVANTAPGTNEWTWISGGNVDNATGVYGTQGTASAEQRARRALRGEFVDRLLRQPLAVRRLWLRLDRHRGQAQRSVAIQSGHPRSGPGSVAATQSMPTGSTAPGHRRSRQRAGSTPGGEFLDRLLRQPVAVRRLWLRLDRGLWATSTICGNTVRAPTQWTWISGGNAANASGVYGTQGTVSASNVPGAPPGGEFLDRLLRQSVAVRRLWLRLDREPGRPQRSVAIQSRAPRNGPAVSGGNVANASGDLRHSGHRLGRQRCRERARRPIPGSTRPATCGCSAARAMAQAVTAISTICGDLSGRSEDCNVFTNRPPAAHPRHGIALTLAGCGGSSSTPTAVTTNYTLGGTISGLTVGSVVLANGSTTVTVAAGASTWIFPGSFAAGSSYTVTVHTQPAGEQCEVTRRQRNGYRRCGRCDGGLRLWPVGLGRRLEYGQCQRSLRHAGHRLGQQRAGRALFRQLLDRLLRQLLAVRWGGL